MKFELSRQIFEKVLNIKFNQNPSSWSRVVPFGQTDKTKLMVDFRSSANAPLNAYGSFSKRERERESVRVRACMTLRKTYGHEH